MWLPTTIWHGMVCSAYRDLLQQVPKFQTAPAGPCWEVVGVVGVDPAVVVAARRDKIDLSDICNRCATGGIRARVAGRRLTSDFMSDRSSSSWLRTCI
jgi:hypothetical protein